MVSQKDDYRVTSSRQAVSVSPSTSVQLHVNLHYMMPISLSVMSASVHITGYCSITLNYNNNRLTFLVQFDMETFVTLDETDC